MPRENSKASILNSVSTLCWKIRGLFTKKKIVANWFKDFYFVQLCAKCGKKEEIVCRPEPSVAEKAQMEAKFQMELKSLSERKRRTFMRYLDRLGKVKDEGWLAFF